MRVASAFRLARIVVVLFRRIICCAKLAVGLSLAVAFVVSKPLALLALGRKGGRVELLYAYAGTGYI